MIENRFGIENLSFTLDSIVSFNNTAFNVKKRKLKKISLHKLIKCGNLICKECLKNSFLFVGTLA